MVEGSPIKKSPNKAGGLLGASLSRAARVTLEKGFEESAARLLVQSIRHL